MEIVLPPPPDGELIPGPPLGPGMPTGPIPVELPPQKPKP